MKESTLVQDTMMILKFYDNPKYFVIEFDPVIELVSIE